MAEEYYQEKTEPATPKRREEVRKRGQVARSAEVNTFIILLFSYLGFYFFGSYQFEKLTLLARGYFQHLPYFAASSVNVQTLFYNVLWIFSLIVFPFMVFVFIGGIITNVLQVGFYATAEPLVPQINRINPMNGLQRIFSKRSLEELVKDILKILVVGFVAYKTIRGSFPDAFALTDQEPLQIFVFISKLTLRIIFRVLIVFLFFSVLDYAFQRWDFEQSIRMTRQEVKDELKQIEGDPLIKARIRSIQREMARSRMMEEVPRAEVVVTNPTSIAVALRYDEITMHAPVIVAKGQRLIAEKIRRIAIENDVPIVENPPLAQALYKSATVGDFIPVELYKAVAEVLAYVYSLNRQKVV